MENYKIKRGCKFNILMPLLGVSMFYLLLYFIGFSLNIFFYIIILYLSPIFVNLVYLFLNKSSNKNESWKNSTILSLITGIVYVVFAKLVENQSGFIEYVKRNSVDLKAGFSINLSYKFSSISQVIFVLGINFAMMLIFSKIIEVNKKR